MNLLILGATGGTGMELVQQAIDRGHSVTAFVRSSGRLAGFQNRIAVKQGDVLNSAELERAMVGHDAVISGFGPRWPVPKTDTHLLQQFASALTTAMPNAGVRRVVVESVAFLFKNSIVPPAYLLGKLLFPGVVADASAMERALKESGLDWTIVRPPELTNKAYTGKYRVREGRLPAFGFKISRADVANFMLTEVEKNAFVRRIVGVSN